jgi:hypothetical protein
MAEDIPQSILRRFAREQRAQAVQAETSFGGPFATADAKAPSFRDRSGSATLSSILFASNIGWSSK